MRHSTILVGHPIIPLAISLRWQACALAFRVSWKQVQQCFEGRRAIRIWLMNFFSSLGQGAEKGPGRLGLPTAGAAGSAPGVGRHSLCWPCEWPRVAEEQASLGL